MDTEAQQQHTAIARKNMTEMHNKSEFADVTIKCGPLIFIGHRVVLAAHSPYLKAMFIHDMKDDQNAPLEITAPLDPNATEHILQYMYTGQINLDENAQLELILEAADYMQVLPVVKLCSDKLLASVSPQKFLQQLQIFEKYCMNQHRVLLVNYLSERFDQVQTSDEYLQLPHQFLRELIRNRNFLLIKDKTIQALINWAKHEPEVRICQLDLLLDSFDYHTVPIQFVYELSEDSFCWQVPKLLKIIQMVIEGKRCGRTEHTGLMHFQDDVITCQFFDHFNKVWLPKMDFAKPEQIKRDDVKYVLAHENSIYFFTTEKVHRLDVEMNTWTDYCEFSANNAEPFCAIFCENYLYVFERHNFRRLNVLSLSNHWEKIATLTEYEVERFLVIENGGAIYIISKTLDYPRSTLSLCVYNDEANKWIPKSIELDGASQCLHFCLASIYMDTYLMDNLNKTIYTFSTPLVEGFGRGHWSMTKLPNFSSLDFVWKSMFYSSMDDAYHMFNSRGLMDVYCINDSDLPPVVDSANRFKRLEVCSYDCSYWCEMLEDDIDYVLSLNLCF